MINRVIRALPLLAAVTFAIMLTGLSQSASARVWVGFGFPLYVGPPAYYPPPVYYPPPPYYAPPTYYYPPPPAYPYVPPAQYRGYAQSCVVTGTVCPMEHPAASGSSCYCTTSQGRVWGRAT